MSKLNWHTGYILGLILAAFLLFYFASNLGLILFVAILLSLLLQPAKKLLERKCSAGVSSLGALLLFIAVAALFVSWITHNLLPGLKQFIAAAPGLISAHTLDTWLVSLNLSPETIEYIHNLLKDSKNFAVSAVKGSIVPLIHALSGIVELIGVPFIVFYLLKDNHKLLEMFVSFVPVVERAKIVHFFEEVSSVLGGYIKGQVFVSLISGSTVYFFFMLIGLQYSSVFAAISAVCELIPVVGPLTASLLAIIFALTVSPAMAIKVAVFYFIMFKINHNIVYPTLIGRAIRLHPVVIMVGLLLFGNLFGALGMMMAVPTMAILRVILDNILPKYDV